MNVKFDFQTILQKKLYPEQGPYSRLNTASKKGESSPFSKCNNLNGDPIFSRACPYPTIWDRVHIFHWAWDVPSAVRFAGHVEQTLEFRSKEAKHTLQFQRNVSIHWLILCRPSTCFKHSAYQDFSRSVNTMKKKIEIT